MSEWTIKEYPTLRGENLGHVRIVENQRDIALRVDRDEAPAIVRDHNAYPRLLKAAKAWRKQIVVEPEHRRPASSVYPPSLIELVDLVDALTAEEAADA